MESIYDENYLIDYKKWKYMFEFTITDFGTIHGSHLKEQKLDNFLKKFKKAMKKNIKENHVEYDKKINRFVIVRYGFEHLVNINEEAMEDYVFEKYNNITAVLDELYKESLPKIEKLELIELEKQNMKEKATEIELSNKMPSLADAPTYVKYLEEENKEKAREIRHELFNLGLVSAPFTLAGLLAGAATGNPLIGLAAAITGFNGQSLIGLITLKETMYDWLDEIITKISTKTKERKMNKYRIKQIKSLNNYDNIVLPNSFEIDQIDEQVEEPLLSLKDPVLDQLDRLINRILLVNREDKVPLLEEAKILVNEYNTRYNAIQNSKTSALSDLNADTEMKLKSDIISKITLLELEISDIRNKDIKIGSVEEQSAKLVKKIERINNETNQDHKSLQRKRK